jgi:hypothetical protein
LGSRTENPKDSKVRKHATVAEPEELTSRFMGVTLLIFDLDLLIHGKHKKSGPKLLSHLFPVNWHTGRVKTLCYAAVMQGQRKHKAINRATNSAHFQLDLDISTDF